MSLLHPGLQAFVAVVDQSTVYGAARQIGLSQTGVTQRIRALEKQVGATLFTRSRKGMRPTSEGEALYRYCQRVLDLEGELLPSLQEEDRGQEVNVGFTGPSSMMRCRVIPKAIRALSHFNNVTFSFNLDDVESGLDHLKSGRSQLAVIRRHEVVNELDSKLMKPAKHILVATKEWESRSALDIVKTERIIDFNKKDETTFDYLKKFKLFKAARKHRHLTNNIDALASLLTKGHGYSVLIQDFAKSFVEAGTLININPGKIMKQEFALAWYPRHEMPKYFSRIISEIE